MFVALSCSVLLALISSIIGTSIGPSLRILGGEANTLFLLPDLVGPKLAALIQYFFPIESISGATLLSSVPFMLAGLALLKAIFYFSQNYIWENVSELISKDLRQDLIEKYLASKIVNFREKNAKDQSADISAILSTDIRLIREYLVHFYGGLPREILQVVFLSLTLFFLSAKLFVVFFFGLLPAVAVTYNLGKKFKKRTEKALGDYSFLTEWLQQRFLGIETIKHLGTENLEITKMKTLNDVLFSRLYKAAKTKALAPPLVEFIAISALVGVFSYSLFLIYENELTSSVALSFFASLAMLSQSTSELSRYLISNRQGAAAGKRLKDLEASLLSSGENLKAKHFSFASLSPELALSLRDINFSYPQSEGFFNNYSVAFRKGTIYCLKGPSGVGKSTLVKLILGLLHSDSGKIELSSYLASYERILVYVPQDIMLLSASIARNVSYPLEDYDSALVWQALEKVGLADFVHGLAEKEHTQVGARGRMLSGGQGQRLHLARLFYHKPPLAIIDEGTSNLDVEVEALISRVLLELKNEGMCIIAISHRPSFFKIADEVIELKAR